MTPKKTKHCRAAGALVFAVLPVCVALVGSWSSVGAEEVIMYRDQAPDPDELADVLFPPAPPPAEKPKMRMRGLRVTGSSSESTSGSLLGGSETEAVAVDRAKPKPSGGKAVGFNIQFSLNSAELLPDTLPYLDSVGQMLTLSRTQGVRLKVTGHADASGNAVHNLRLSEARAVAVKDYLVKTYGVTPERLETIGRGEESPLPGTDPFDGVNRRVEFHPLN